MSRPARLYLYVIYVLGLAGLFRLLTAPAKPVDLQGLVAAILLAALGATMQIFVVTRAGSDYSDHLTPAALFAAFLLLPSPVLAAVVVLIFVPEWIWYRRKWYIQIFNIGIWLIAVTAGRFVLELPLDHLASGIVSDPRVIPALAALVVVLDTQTLLLAIVLKLARGQSLRESGLFAPSKLFVEAALYCSGWAFAIAWTVDPWYGLAALLPLGLIFQALHVPNLKEEAMTDPKTGLANMRHFNYVLQRDLERAERNGQTFALLMCDLDYLRNINNTYGHQAGDLVLNGIAGVIRQSIRGCDLAGRFGGEEFCILLADTDSMGAMDVAERLRGEIEQNAFVVGPHGPEISATISIGIAIYPLDARSTEGLMREADLAVYQAKREGRNRVVVASRESRELAAEWARDNLVPVAADASRDETTQPLRRFVADATRSSYHRLTGAPTLQKRPSASSGKGGGGDVRARSPGAITLFIGFVVLFSLLTVVASALLRPGQPGQSWVALVLFTALTILAQQLAVDVDQHRGLTSVSVVPILAVSLLYDDLAIVFVCAAFAIWTKVKAHSPVERMLFNLAMVILAAESADWVFKLLIPAPMGSASFEEMLLPATAAGLVYFAVNHCLLSIVRGLNEHRSPRAVFSNDYRWLWPYYAVFGALSLVIATGYAAFGWTGVIAMMAPVGVMHLSIKQYMDRTTVYVNELRSLNRRVSDSYEATLQALTRALDTRDEETEEHSQRVRRYTELIAREYGISAEEIEHISRGALLHDIGKIGVPDAILLKPQRLTPEEHALMRKHPLIGYSMIADIPFLTKAAEIVLHHHEAYDGSGYPSGLGGERIPLGARIFAVADTIDAMTSDRPYRKALPLSDALAEIRRCRGQQFDPSVVDTLFSIPIEDLLACRIGPAEAQRGNRELLGPEMQRVG